MRRSFAPFILLVASACTAAGGSPIPLPIASQGPVVWPLRGTPVR